MWTSDLTYHFMIELEIIIALTRMAFIVETNWLELHRMDEQTRCEHCKVDQTSAPLYEGRGFLGQTPISCSRMLYKIDYYS